MSNKSAWTDKHYSNYYELTEKDIESGKVKIDPYFISKMSNLGSKDQSSCLFHTLKTIIRWGEKNDTKREILAVINQMKRYAELNNIDISNDTEEVVAVSDMEI